MMDDKKNPAPDPDPYLWLKPIWWIW